MRTDTAPDWQHKQAQHYNRIATQYEAHYSDRFSQEYRRRFINQSLLAGIQLAGKRVLEAMCGSGQTTGYLISQGARVTGLDISANLMASFQKSWPGCEALCASIFDTAIESDSFDCVVVVGGLHHLQPEVQRAIDEVHRILRPGGSFCFAEPHAGSLPDTIRRLWYRCDSLFEKNEKAIAVEELSQANSHRFDLHSVQYRGHIAYLLVLNSLIFRVPLPLKRLYAPWLMAVEAATTPLLTRRLSCFVVCQWRKR